VKFFICTDDIFLVSDLVDMVYTLEFDTLCHGFSLYTRLDHLLNGKGLLYCTHCEAFVLIKGWPCLHSEAKGSVSVLAS